MSRLRKLLALGWFGLLLTAFAAWALCLPLLFGLSLKQEAGMAALYALAFAAVLHLHGMLPRKARFLPPLLLLVYLLAGAFFLPQSLPARLLAFARTAASGASLPHAMTLYLGALLPFALVLLTLYAQLLLEGDPAFALPLMVAPLLMMWFMGAREQMMAFVPAVLCLPLIYLYTGRQGEGPLVQAPPRNLLVRGLALALALALIAFALTPQKRTTMPAAERMADRLRQRIEDMLQFTSTRSAFSLGTQGYQPMGDNQLGGKPNISQSPVMTVATERKLYLRGTILDAYTGRTWYDSLSGNRYNWQNLRYLGLRADLFNENLPENERTSSAQASVTLLSELPTTLFVPQRLRTLTPGPDMTAYFNTSSEVFITRDLRNGDTYSFRYEPYVAGEAGTDALALRLAGQEGLGELELAQEYYSLPGHLQPDGIVAELARDITGGLNLAYEKAQAIRRYLRSNYTYSLDVPPAPENQDFAAHFLFDQQSGYCTYFATAMTVLARSAGLPARYVEGFLADPQGQGSVTLTGANAHAWTEIYIQGLGWVVFDATAPENGQTGEDGDQPPPGQPSPSPSPDPSPSPSPSPEPSEAPTQAPGDAATPTPPPEGGQPSPEPSPHQEPESADESGPPRPPFPWWLLLLLALAALLAWRVREEAPKRKETRLTNRQDVLRLYWMESLRVHKARKLQPCHQESPLEYAARAQETQPGLNSLARSYSAWVYGKQVPDQGAVEQARRHYGETWASLPPFTRAALALSRGVMGLPAFFGGLARAGWQKLMKQKK